MKTVVKIEWRTNEIGEWIASLLTVDEDGYKSTSLNIGDEINTEIRPEKRCTGYHSEIGERQPCPDFKQLNSGHQCRHCREQDIYSEYVEGRRGLEAPGVDFSVYLAQAGSMVKVGVTRTEKLMRRWVEQGADYGAEIESGLSSQEALDLESEISGEGVTQRIRKEEKTENHQERITDELLKLGYDVDVTDVQGQTVYPEMRCENIRRRGRFMDEIQSVKGQILSNGAICMVFGSGYVIGEPVQSGLEDF